MVGDSVALAAERSRIWMGSISIHDGGLSIFMDNDDAFENKHHESKYVFGQSLSRVWTNEISKSIQKWVLQSIRVSVSSQGWYCRNGGIGDFSTSVSAFGPRCIRRVGTDVSNKERTERPNVGVFQSERGIVCQNGGSFGQSRGRLWCVGATKPSLTMDWCARRQAARRTGIFDASVQRIRRP